MLKSATRWRSKATLPVKSVGDQVKIVTGAATRWHS